MFKPAKHPRLFGLPPGADFATALVAGLRARSDDLSRTTLFVNTARMQRRLREVFDSGPACLLPRIRLVTDLGIEAQLAGLPEPIHPLRRRLELSQAVATVLQRVPDLAPASALFALTDSLAALMEEMHGEGVSPDAFSTLDTADQSGHWQRSLALLNLLRPYFDTDAALPDPQARQRAVATSLADRWETEPPADPIIIAGSTGSRGATAVLMTAVARLPQGAVVLPGYDFDMPAPVWDSLYDAMRSEDHPQYRFRVVLDRLGLAPDQVQHWHEIPAPVPDRNRLISLALRPAPVTSQWRVEGPTLGNLPDATTDMTLVETDTPREEAETIALRLRSAIDEGLTAALITPDRMLTRQVAAALDRWDITPDDSAGLPLDLSAPGRLLRQMADALGAPISAEALLALLKHPLTHSGGDRNRHLLRARELELHIRRHGPPFPTGQMLRDWAANRSKHDTDADRWGAWLGDIVDALPPTGPAPLADHLSRHLTLASQLCTGSAAAAAEGGELYAEKAGREALRLCTLMTREADAAGTLSIRDYAGLFAGIIKTGTVRDRDTGHPQVLIWGTLEARVGGADLVILGGLNDGTWPEAPSPDPWLNRSMRNALGLLLPERRIGLSAHDFQQAVCAPQVVLTRAKRSADAETVPSRWLNRLTNLMSGLPDQSGPDALAAMRGRGDIWIAQAAQLSRPTATVKGAPRPSPAPPVDARPKRISVTQVKTLIRDPYAIYAKEVLRLKPLDPLQPQADGRLRGVVFHEILERFIETRPDATDPATRDLFLKIADDVLDEHCPWLTIRHKWRAQLHDLAPRLMLAEAARQVAGDVLRTETWGEVTVEPHNVLLTCKADRVDVDADGRALIYDYKTGPLPSEKVQKAFDKQLLLEAAMIQRGAFADVGRRSVTQARFLGINGDLKEVPAPLADHPPDEVWIEFARLLAAWADPTRGYTARMAMFQVTQQGDYDHLSRFGEWDTSDAAIRINVDAP